MSKPNFGITNNNGITIAGNANGSGAASMIDANGAFRDVMIYNPGPNVARVRAGAAGVQADATCMPLLPGEKSAYFKGPATHMAVFGVGGAQSVEVYVGEGE